MSNKKRKLEPMTQDTDILAPQTKRPRLQELLGHTTLEYDPMRSAEIDGVIKANQKLIEMESTSRILSVIEECQLIKVQNISNDITKLISEYATAFWLLCDECDSRVTVLNQDDDAEEYKCNKCQDIRYRIHCDSCDTYWLSSEENEEECPCPNCGKILYNHECFICGKCWYSSIEEVVCDRCEYEHCLEHLEECSVCDGDMHCIGASGCMQFNCIYCQISFCDALQSDNCPKCGQNVMRL